MRGALAPDPSLFLSSLDGTFEQGLVFGHGTLSPDGTKFAYSDENNQLFILDIASGGRNSLGNGFSPVWSPEDGQIAFLRETEKGTNIFVLNVNGGASRPLTDTTEFFNLAGWNGDGTQLLIESGNKIDMLNVADGSRHSLLVTNYDFYNSPRPAISPDGQWLAYLERVPGRRTPGIYLARLDGSETRLLVQLDDWTATVSLFSPDSKWLAINLRNPEIPNATITPALVNLDTCQIVPLPDLNGEIRSWVK
jgi:Tol biopolymer transport system component